MNILVCLKAVPDPSALIEISDDHLSLRVVSSAPYMMSSLDEHALEEALTLKDSCTGVQIHAISIGDEDRSLPLLQRAMGMGADRAIVGGLRNPGLSDHPLVVASALASWAKIHPYSLYMVGASSDDLMQGQVGPMLAELMGLPCATCVVCVEPITDETIIVEREIHGGLRCRLEVDLPAVITILSSKHTPRYPSLSNMLRAKKTSPEYFMFDSEPLLENCKLRVSYHEPPKNRTAIFLQGDVGVQADQLIGVLRSKGLI